MPRFLFHLLEERFKLRDPLYRNSIFIMATSFLTSVVGFAFWILGARLCSDRDVGTAVAMISYVSLPIAMSRLGLDQAIVRFFPEGRKGTMLFTSMAASTFIALVASVCLIASAGYWSNDLKLSISEVLYYFLFVAAGSLLSIANVALLAMKRGDMYFGQSLVLDLRLALIVPFAALGAMGIFISYGLSVLMALSFSMLVLVKLGVKSFGIDVGFLKSSFSFSIGNYVVGLLMSLPVILIPITVLAILGPEDAAHYYVAYAVSSMLFVVPGAIGMSLFVEGSHGAPLGVAVRKSIVTSYAIVIPAAIILWFAGGGILDTIGPGYATATYTLQLMAASSIFFVVWSMYYSVRRVQKRIGEVVAVSLVISLSLLLLSIVFSLWIGIDGLGYPWIVSYGIGGLMIACLARRTKWE